MFKTSIRLAGGAAVMLFGAPAGAQVSAHSGVSRRFDVGHEQLYLECAGSGSPVILFEAGAGNASPTWDPIWDRVTSLSRACRYDRAGLGQSGGEVSESPSVAAENLAQLLAVAGVDGPFVLVGHSLGALHVRMFTAQNPGWVAGVVLVDGLHELQRTRVLQLTPPDDAGEAAAWRDYLANQRTRQPRDHAGVDSLVIEMAATSLGDLPLIVISAGRPIGTPPPGFPAGMAQHMEQLWIEGQQKLVRLSPRSEHVVVDDAGHYVHRERPQVVVDAIRRMLNMVRSSLP